MELPFKFIFRSGLLQYKYRYGRNFFYHYWYVFFIILLVLVKSFVLRTSFLSDDYTKYLGIGFVTWKACTDPMIFTMMKSNKDRINNTISVRYVKLKYLSDIVTSIFFGVSLVVATLFLWTFSFDLSVMGFLSIGLYLLVLSTLSAILGICISALLSSARDLISVVPSITTVLFWSTPVVWIASDEVLEKFYILYNPLFWIINGARWLGGL